jgi:poly(3-hydroxybutyrate) depolymerase
MLSRHLYKHCKRSLAVIVMVLPGIVACGDQSQQTADSIPAVEYDAALRSRISVAGVSSGAYMAVQAQVAYADKIGGVAVVAGGPYHCAAGDVKTALGSCMTGMDLAADPRGRQ